MRSWTSTSNLTTKPDNSVIEVTAPLRIRQRPSSWSSTPELDDEQKLKSNPNEEIVFNVQIPVRKRNTASINIVEESFTLKKPVQLTPVLQHKQATTVSIKSDVDDDVVVINQTDSLAERVRKMQLIKRQGSLERELTPNRESIKNER